MNGGNDEGSVVSVGKVFTRERLEYVMTHFAMKSKPVDGSEHLFSSIILFVVENLEARSTSSVSLFPADVEKLLVRLFPPPASAIDLDILVPALEELIVAPWSVQKTAGEKMTEARQLARNTIIRMFCQAFGIEWAGSDRNFFLQFNLEPRLVETLLEFEELRMLGVELMLLTLYTFVARKAEDHVEGVQATLYTLSREDEEFEQESVRLRPTQPTQPPRDARDEQVALLKAQLHSLQAQVSRLTRRPTRVEAPVTARRHTRAVLSAPPGLSRPLQTSEKVGGVPVQELLSDSDSDSDDDVAYGHRSSGKSSRGRSNSGESTIASSVRTNSSRATSRTANSRGSPYLQGPLLKVAFERARENFELGSELSLDEMLNMLLSATDGLLLVGVDGIPATMKMQTLTRHTLVAPKIVSQMFNPDADPYLASLGSRKTSAHLFPATLAQFDALISDTFLKLMNPSPLFPEASAKVRGGFVSILTAYQRKIHDLVAGLCGGLCSSTALQSNPHHITIWAIILLFHLNRWMRAMVHGKISLLVDDFDSTWFATYAGQVGSQPKSGYGLLLSDLLMFLGYRCPRCYRLGAFLQFCSSETCQTTLRGPKVGSEAKGGGNAEYNAALKSFLSKQADTTRSSANIAAFKKSAVYKDHPEWAVRAAAAPMPTNAVCQDFYDRQQCIPQHVLPCMRASV